MDAWKTLKSKTVFDAPPFVKVVQETVDVGDGKIIDDFYQVRLRSFVTCVPVLPDGRLLTLRQYKHGPRQVSISFPAGFMEEGEDAETSCVRELLEETGYQPESMIALGSFVDNGNQQGCTGHYFIATGCHYVQEPDSGDLEEMEINTHTAADMDAAMFNGDMAIIHHVAAWGMARLWANTNQPGLFG